MTPREYQTRALDAVRAQFQAGKRAVLVVSPTGSGKSTIGAMMAAGHVARQGHVLWVSHRIELQAQAAETLRGAGLDVGHQGLFPSAPTQVVSIQKLSRRREVPDGMSLCIFDEAHHLADKSDWAEIPKHYLGAGARVVGLTATPSRGDGLALEGFDALVVAAQISELQKLGHLVPLRVRRPGKMLRKDTIAQSPVDAYLAECRGRSAVVFAPHVKAAEQYTAEFRQLGIDAELVTGETPYEVRAASIGRFAIGRLRVLVNVAVLTEGWDAPRCAAVILARSCGSPGLLIQMAGRALRPHPGKRDALLVDLRGVTHALGRPDADAEYSLSGEGIALKGAKAGERMCRVCGLPLGEATVCPECGRGTELVVPKPIGAKLVDWAEQVHDAVKDVMKPRRDVLSLAGMIAKHGDKKAVFIFRKIFKRHPSQELMGLARAFNRSKASAAAPFAPDEGEK